MTFFNFALQFDLPEKFSVKSKAAILQATGIYSAALSAHCKRR